MAKDFLIQHQTIMAAEQFRPALKLTNGWFTYGEEVPELEKGFLFWGGAFSLLVS